MNMSTKEMAMALFYPNFADKIIVNNQGIKKNYKQMKSGSGT